MTSNTYWSSAHNRGLARAGFSELERIAVKSIAPMFHYEGYVDYLEKPEDTPPQFRDASLIDCPIWVLAKTVQQAGVEYGGSADFAHPDIYWPIERIVKELGKKTTDPLQLARKLDEHVFLEQGENKTYTLFFERIECNESREPVQQARF